MEADLNQIFDLDRSQLTQKIVDQMEAAMHDIETANDDLKAIIASAKEATFSKNEVAAMKQVAKLRVQDKRAETREKLAALERVSKACSFDLFD